MAASAAWIARRSPEASPVPIIALPMSRMIGAHVGEVEIDEAFLDHQVGDAGDARIEHLVGHREGVGEGRLLVGDAEQVLVGDDDQRVDGLLQLRRCRSRPTRMRRVPSNWNGLVTTPTVRMPISRAARAMTGAAPVPVPPPMPAVTNTMCDAGEVIADFLDRLLGGRAADLGLRAGAEALGDLQAHLDDAVGAATSVSACASVLATTKSTPARPDVIMLLTALPPAPPTPHTVMRGFSSLQFRRLQIDRHCSGLSLSPGRCAHSSSRVA